MNWRRLRLVAGAAAIAALAPPVAIGAAGTGSGAPEVSASESAVPGERITIRLSGFTTDAVTVSVCGNEARRGSADCNLPGSTSIGTGSSGAPVEADFVMVVPPTTCPCVLRATSRDNTQLAVTPIRILGHPSAPVEGQPAVADVVQANVTVTPVEGTTVDRLRGALGGPITYEVVVEVTNTAGVALRNLVVSGAVSSGGDEPTLFAIPKPEAIGPGATYVVAVEHRLGALDVGTTEWTVTVGGAGDSVSASTTTSTEPTLLVVLIALVVLLLFLIPLRHVVARHRERGGPDEPPASEQIIEVYDRTPEPVG